MRPRWFFIAVCALALGVGSAVALAATGGASPCPRGFKFTPQRNHKPAYCLGTKTVSRTVTTAGPTQTATLPGDTVTAPGLTTTVAGAAAPAPPPSTVTVPTTTTVTSPPITETVTAPPQTVTDFITTTVTTSVVSGPGSATLAWCGGRGGSWRPSDCSAPPSPLAVSAGASVLLNVSSTGSLVDEPFPAGYLTFTVDGPGSVTASDQLYGLNPDASQDCSRVENYSGQAEGGCALVFGSPGRYTVTASFVDTDGRYGYPAPISTTINVG